MITSNKKNIALLTDIFIQKGLSDIVISPGSRNAPIILSFTNRVEINALSVVDERSAAFFAMGMAQQKKKTVAIACTSGSAVLNYAPAIAEAYYQKIPLLILTADRPPELIDKGDGQTIRQKNVFSNYVKASFELPIEINNQIEFDHSNQIINQAIDLCQYPEPGPVHINIPFREPLYQTTDEIIKGSLIDSKIETPLPGKTMFNKLAEQWNQTKKILVLVGQMEKNEKLNQLLSEWANNKNVVVLTETTSNLNDDSFIDCIDNIVSTFEEEEAAGFYPDLLISFGGQVVSKMIKKFLRDSKAQVHWHISPSGEEMDTYFCLTESVGMKPEIFIEQLNPVIQSKSKHFFQNWLQRKQQIQLRRENYLNQIPYSDLQVFEVLLRSLPGKQVCHFGNSTPVRYSQLFGHLPNYIYRSNRGVSGIDGQISTASGAAFADDQIHTIITGDLGFFYDSNALMNKNLPPNLKIIVINNGGGGIFRFLDGPASTPQAEEFFAASHNWKSEKIAEAFGLNYFMASDISTLKNILTQFYNLENSASSVLEIFTPEKINAQVLRDYFLYLKKRA